MELNYAMLHAVVHSGPAPLFAAISGAHLYGFPSPDSDVDLRGSFVLPLDAVLRLRDPEETITISQVQSGVEIDWVAHDIRKFARLMLKRNGYVLEQLFSPLVVFGGDWLDELRTIGRGCITRHLYHHYLGFAHTQLGLLAKFVRLALQGNPNIIEVLYVEPADILYINRFGEHLLAARKIFLSRHVGETFSRYAIAQLKRMVNHHRWLLEPPDHQPQPTEFGATMTAGRARFPDSDSERAYRAALKHWNNYQTWRRDRNPARAELEEKHGYDTKHAMHLLRLLHMGEEILHESVVCVKRPDAAWLKSVRNGALTYKEVIDLAARHEAALSTLIERSPLPDEPDTVTADRLLIQLQQEFLLSH